MPETVTPVVPEQSPNQAKLYEQPKGTPYASSWFTSQTIANVPADAVGWLLAQGWKITDVTQDTSSVPPIYYYAMQRISAQNLYILQSLINEYVFAYNTAKGMTERRYNDVIDSWTDMLDSSHTHFTAQIAEQDAHAALFLGNLDTYMQAVDDLIEANQAQIIEDAAKASAALATMDTKLADLESNAATNAEVIGGRGGLLEAQSSYLSTFLGNFSNKLAELSGNYLNHLDKVEALLSDATTDLGTFALTQAPALQAISDAYTAHAESIDSLLTTAATNLSDVSSEIDSLLIAAGSDYGGVESAVNTILGDCDNSFGSFVGDYDKLLGKLESDFDSHYQIATGFLENLGATELARINEAFTASLSAQFQNLTDRGLYSSIQVTDVTARNIRDRDEQIAALNDRLAREKLENEHTLYGQRVAMRAATMSGKERSHAIHQEVLHYKAAQVLGLYQLLQATRERTLNLNVTLSGLRDANLKLNVEVQTRLYELGQALQRLLIEEAARVQQLAQAVRQWAGGERNTLLGQVQEATTQHLAGLDKQHAAQQDISRVAMNERNQLLNQLQEAVKGFLSGKEHFASMTMQAASTLAEHKHRIVLEKMNEYAAKLEGRRNAHADAMKLMAYQLDERNKMLIGLYGFVERRTDEGPRFEELVRLCASLGDSGGGWVTP
jgi:hypothetical protein